MWVGVLNISFSISSSLVSCFQLKLHFPISHLPWDYTTIVATYYHTHTQYITYICLYIQSVSISLSYFFLFYFLSLFLSLSIHFFIHDPNLNIVYNIYINTTFTHYVIMYFHFCSNKSTYKNVL